MSELTLSVNKVSYSGWSDVHLHRSIDEISGSFILSIANFFYNVKDKPDIAMGDDCTIEINGQLILTGYIEILDISYGPDYNVVVIGGRDVTGDLVDCSYDSTVNEWKQQSLQNLVTNLCAPFNIPVTVDSSVSTPAATIIESFKANEGETVFETISELCRMNTILPISIGDGKLTLTEGATKEYTNNGIESGVNVFSGRLSQNDENRYSSYTVKGQGIGNDNKALADFVEPSHSLTDPIMSRIRPLVMLAETSTNNGQCKKNGIWESRIRAGHSRLLNYELSGWTQDNGDVWEINKLIRVKDSFLNIEDTRLISEIDFYYDGDKGERTILTLVDKNTYKLTEDEINIKTEFDR